MKNLWYSDRNYNTDWQLEMFKRGKDIGHDAGFKGKFKYKHMLLVHIGIASTYIFPIIKCFTISFRNKFQLLSMLH